MSITKLEMLVLQQEIGNVRDRFSPGAGSPATATVSSAVYPENVDCCRQLLDALTDCCRWFAVVVMAQPAAKIVGRVPREREPSVHAQQNIPYYIYIYKCRQIL